MADKKKRFVLNQWRGLNTMKSSENREPGELEVCKNWDFTRPGLMVKRRGAANWGAATAQNIKKLLFLKVQRGEPKYAVVLTALGAYAADITSAAPASWVECTNSAGIAFTRDLEYYLDGVPINWKQNVFTTCYDSSHHRLRMFTDEREYQSPWLVKCAAPAVATGAAGALTGDYYYKVCYRSTRRVDATDYTIISNASVASSLVQPSSQKVDVTSIPVGTDPDATNKYIYRTKAGGSVYYYVASITNATESYEDNITDAYLGAALGDQDHTDLPDILSSHGVPEIHQGRIFVSKRGGTQIAFTEPNEPYYWGYSSASGGTTNIIKLPASSDVGFITGMASMYDTLLIATTRSLWQLQGYYRDTWQLRQIADVGCIAPRTFMKTPYGIMFVSHWGVHLYDGERLQEVSAPIKNMIEDNINAGATAVWHHDRYIARIYYTWYAFFPETGAWSEYVPANWPIHQWLSDYTTYGAIDQTCIAVDSGTKQLIELLKDATYADIGVAYTAQATTGVLPIAIMQQKALKRLFLTAEAGGASTIEVQVILDDAGVTDTSSFTTAAGTDRYAEALPANIVGEQVTLDIQHKLATGSEIAISEVGFDYRTRRASRR